MKDKWIISRHTSDMSLLLEVALLIKKYQNSISEDEKSLILNELEKEKIYTPRFEGAKKSTLNAKIDQLAFYMFGYKTKIEGENKFLFSPLGNLLLKYKGNQEKEQKIFLTMLWALQFTHPHSQTDIEYQIYPFRLLFKLMCEKELNYKLYISEIAYFVMKQKDISNSTYKELVNNILAFRKKSDTQVKDLFLQDNTNTLVNAVYECDYYLRVLLEYFSLVESTQGEIITSLKQGVSTTRKLKKSYCMVSSKCLDYVNKLEEGYSFLEKPLLFTDIKHKQEVVKEIYNFYPQLLLNEIQEEIDYSILQLPKLIDEYSKNKNNKTAYKFEDVLVDGFNTFINVDAQKIAGSGNTDIKCIYLDKELVFAVEAKSTKNKLSLINSGRLQDHRNKVGAEYTIVITPRYVPAVLKDIKNTNNVIITAGTFSEYLYNSILKNERNIDYQEIHSLIVKNLGLDISHLLSDITIKKFAISKEELIEDKG